MKRQRSSLLFEKKEFIQFLAALAVLLRTILINRINSTRMVKKKLDEFILFFKIVLDKLASAARNLINSSSQIEAITFAFSSVFILLLLM